MRKKHLLFRNLYSGAKICWQDSHFNNKVANFESLFWNQNQSQGSLHVLPCITLGHKWWWFLEQDIMGSNSLCSFILQANLDFIHCSILDSSKLIWQSLTCLGHAQNMVSIWNRSKKRIFTTEFYFWNHVQIKFLFSTYRRTRHKTTNFPYLNWMMII